jgi:hypothetical protein
MFTARVLVLNYTAIIFISSLTVGISVLRSVPNLRVKVSSANIRVKREVTLFKSLIKHKNKIGPRMLPSRINILTFLFSGVVFIYF